MAKKNGKANGHAFVGQRFKRKEDPRLIQGISHYADDLRSSAHAFPSSASRA